MFTLFIVLHVIFCLFLILVILLQTGKGAGIGAAFGGGSQTVFGPRGAGSFIGKVTGTVAALFMLTSMILAYQSTSRSGRVAAKAESLQTVDAEKTEKVDLGEADSAKGEADSAKKESSTAATADTGTGKAPAAAEADTDQPKAEDKEGDADTEAPKADARPEGLDAKAATPPGLETAKAPAKPKADKKPIKASVKKPPTPKAEATPKAAEAAPKDETTPAPAPAAENSKSEPAAPPAEAQQ